MGCELSRQKKKRLCSLGLHVPGQAWEQEHCHTINSIHAFSKLGWVYRLYYVFYQYLSVLQIRPPFCNLSLSTKRRGGAYTRDATIFLMITPSLPVKHDLIVGGGWSQVQDREMLPTLVVS